MALAKDVYRAFEDILGVENISEDLAILEGYGCFGFGARGPEPEDRYYPLPEAVVLPATTQEVQAIVKVCSRTGLKFKATSTAYGAHNAVGQEKTIMIDLRRMDRILEIDEKNMYAVFEPYVIFSQLQAEVMKRGLNVHVIGAGSNCSVLASSTSMHGTNTQAISHGWGGRNLLGVEWVLPTGEIIKLGAPGSGAGWFTGDGPGPSLRGIMRGHAGAQSGLGVFTKCAVHLHPWYGPPKMVLSGISPYFETEVPENFEYHLIGWESWQQAADAQYKIGQEGIAFAMHKSGGPGTCGPVVTGNNNEYFDKWEELKGLPWVSFGIVTAAASPEQHAYQVKTLNKIMEETQGFLVEVGEKPIWKKRDYINMVKSCFIPRLSFRTAGSFCCPLQGADTIDHAMVTGLSKDDAFRRKYDDQNLLFNDGSNGMWGVSFDGGHYALFECGHMYSPTEGDSWTAAAEMMGEGGEIALKEPFSIGWTVMGHDVVNTLGPLFNNVQNWQRKIKKALDPNTTADPMGYIKSEEETSKQGGSFGAIFPSLSAEEKEKRKRAAQ
jgi:glycolate oxidase